MKIIDLLNSQQLSLSFEVFPPKTETAFESVKEATEEIAKLKPAFMSVTYGAGGGTSKYTLDIAKNIKELYGVPT
ncbi:MAG: methylenetetrahydrofolate reductase, partial [Clostridia bacterium]|nr:methylenetetrahydrofolate reductase [Clostridia bacterium]